MRALLLAAWAERDSAVSKQDRLRHLLLRRVQFGVRSERLPDEQLQVGLEQAIAQGETEGEKRDPALKQERAARRRASRDALPAHLPRIEVLLAPEDTAWPCCRGAMAVIGHDSAERLDDGSAERLDVIPAQFRVLATRRPKLACRACEVLLAPARVFADEMVAPVLDPGRGQQRNDRLLGPCRGILPCDGCATCKKLADPRRGEDAVTLVFCWSHVRRGFHGLAKAGAAPVAAEAPARIAAPCRTQAEVRGKPAAERFAARQARSQPRVADTLA